MMSIDKQKKYEKIGETTSVSGPEPQLSLLSSISRENLRKSQKIYQSSATQELSKIW